MPSTTIGVKIDDLLRGRLRDAAEAQGRTPHWFVKQAILSAIELAEGGGGSVAEDEPPEPLEATRADRPVQPFLEFAQGVQPQSVLRARITAACRIPEEEAVPLLLANAVLPPAQAEAADTLARSLVTALREKSARGGVEGLIKEYDLSSQEGIALMCLAEALLRIPDRATRDALIRDKISTGNWESHLGRSPSMFVNAATWGLVVTGRLTATSSAVSLSSALTRLIGRGGEPVIRRGVDMAMRMMGEQFVTGQTIAEALANSRRLEKQGFRHSYDMLGEAAMTAEDAERYHADYERAIHAIGRASARRGIYEGAGISIKLSALHPRYSRSQRDRVMHELLPRLRALAQLARSYDIGLNIDAEEADRLELSLDLLEALCHDPALAGWNGIGFVVQAYQKRAPFVIDWIIALARTTSRRIMLRLVKGAYWDSEIKRAQQDGLEGFPVFTRKAHTDISYIACARRLLAAPDAVFPQFATHNARTLASIHAMAGPNFYIGQYEFQCLHGMGEPLYEEVVGHNKLNRPCRIYAPVGTHETLLAYLVRRLLENGANTSFVNRIGDAAVPIEELVADPALRVAAGEPVGSPEPRIALPRALFVPRRLNSEGLDLASEQRLASLAASLLASGRLGLDRDRARPRCRGLRGGRNRQPRAAAGPGRPDAPNPARCRAGAGPRRRGGRTALARHPARGACRNPVPGRLPAGSRDAAARRAGRARGRQDPVGRHRRDTRGGGLPALLRLRGARRFRQRDAPPAWRRGVHQPLELPARHLHGPGRGGAGRRQCGAGEARGGDTADRRPGGAPAARGRRSRGGPATGAGRRRDRRRPGGPPRCARGDVHRLDRCRPGHPAQHRRTPQP